MSGAKQIYSKVTTEQLAKIACVYVRQSTISQVLHHGESTELQYGLVNRAVQLGWPQERIRVIDADLGKSAASAEDRQGFQTLLADIGLGKVGIVLSMEASRLSRKSSDWYQLLELCSLFGTLIADGESLYDPRVYSDRLLLGLTGIMSEAELHQIKLRMQAGARNKAERGELIQPLPVGLVRLTSQEVILNPDMEVRSRLRLVFQKFKELGTARSVVRYLQKENQPLPSRPLIGPAPQETVWRKASASCVLEILKNPAYAGTYVYGQTTHDPARRQPGRWRLGMVRRPLEEWPVILLGIYPAYISWEEYLANQAQLRANGNRYKQGQMGAPKKGAALLQGIVLCGRCASRMRLEYSGRKGEYPVYKCCTVHDRFAQSRCQEVRAFGLDQEVEQLILSALVPDQLAIALAAYEQVEQERTVLTRQWQLRLERARYEAERAQRQYNAVEPENRLVAHSLEQLWEAKLRAEEQLEHEYQSWQRRHQMVLTAQDREEILALGENLPAVWHAPTTTPIDRKSIVRLVIREVIVDQDRVQGKVWFQINWQTGARSEHWYTRRVLSYAAYADGARLEKRIRELHAQLKMDEEIASVLNAEGFRSAHRQPFTRQLIGMLRKQWGLITVVPQGSLPDLWEDGSYSIMGAAKRVGVFPGTVYHWVRSGRVEAKQVAKGTPWRIYLDEQKVVELQMYLKRISRSKREVV
jgi:DNA invertase Pin-like site-specific DNA recombinase